MNTHPADSLTAALTSARATDEHILSAVRHLRAALDLSNDDDRRRLHAAVLQALIADLPAPMADASAAMRTIPLRLDFNALALAQ